MTCLAVPDERRRHGNHAAASFVLSYMNFFAKPSLPDPDVPLVSTDTRPRVVIIEVLLALTL